MRKLEGRRFTLIEYGDPAPLVSRMAGETGLRPAKLRDLLMTAGERAAQVLGLKESPLRWSGEHVRAEDFAGLLLVAPGLELEVAPKFLGEADGWREDFFLLATLSHHGRLLDSEGLQASSANTSDLATLIGRSLVESYWRNHRRPLRSYRRTALTDFAVDGDFDAADLLLPGEDGFEQVVTSFTRRNSFNAVIRAAAEALAPTVPDPETRARLERVVHRLPHQARPARLDDCRLPSRGRTWQPTYDLSLDVLRGLGGAYDAGKAVAPGYVVQTWRTWETLLSLSLKAAFGRGTVRSQREFRLGDRVRPDGHAEAFRVKPDDVVVATKDTVGFIVDAKYKGRFSRPNIAVDAADVYEALAFAQATGLSNVVLAYPRVPKPGPRPEVGMTTEVERINVGGVTVIAVDVSVQGISERLGLRRFAASLSEGIQRVI